MYVLIFKNVDKIFATKYFRKKQTGKKRFSGLGIVIKILLFDSIKKWKNFKTEYKMYQSFMIQNKNYMNYKTFIVT